MLENSHPIKFVSREYGLGILTFLNNKDINLRIKQISRNEYKCEFDYDLVAACGSPDPVYSLGLNPVSAVENLFKKYRGVEIMVNPAKAFTIPKSLFIYISKSFLKKRGEQ